MDAVIGDIPIPSADAAACLEREAEALLGAALGGLGGFATPIREDPLGRFHNDR